MLVYLVGAVATFTAIIAVKLIMIFIYGLTWLTLINNTHNVANNALLLAFISDLKFDLEKMKKKNKNPQVSMLLCLVVFCSADLVG